MSIYDSNLFAAEVGESRHTILPSAKTISDARRASIRRRAKKIYATALAMRDERTKQQPLPTIDCPTLCGCTELGDCPLIGVSPR